MEIANAEAMCIGHVCIPETYNKNIVPLQNETNHVTVDFRGINILKVDDEEFTITLYLWQTMFWKDPRLTVQSHSEDFHFEDDLGNHTATSLNIEIIDVIWFPKPMVHNLRSINTVNNRLSLVDQKFMWYSSLLEISIYCPMLFDDYPFDHHVCYFKMSSKGFGQKLIYQTNNVTTAETEVEYDRTGNLIKKLQNSDYRSEVNKLPEEERFFRWGMTKKDIHNTSLAGFEIELWRKYEKYIIYYYIPSGLLTITSTVCNYISRSQDPFLKIIFLIYIGYYDFCSWDL